MALYLALGSTTTSLSDDDLRSALVQTYDQLGPRRKVAAVPPDFSRYASRAGDLTCMTHDYYGGNLVDVLPAVGTHVELPDKHRRKMFPTVPPSLFRYHNWRTDAEPIGTVDAQFVADATEGLYRDAWPVQLNRLLWQGGHDLIISLGQVVPHEVIGMANYNKNLFVGTGGVSGINESHYIGAVYGMERTMGRGDTPLRRILNRAQDAFCRHLPLLFVLTVIGPDSQGASAVRGLFIGDDAECFWRACELAEQVNITWLDEPQKKVVVSLDAEKFPSTWLGNKAIYRTRMAMADDGELIILAPGVSSFGEDADVDKVIRKYGYRTTPELRRCVAENADLQANLAAAAHLMHGSSENRFRITYCPGNLTAEEVRSVGYDFADWREMAELYQVAGRPNGLQRTATGESFYYISDPAMGLWRLQA